MLSPSKNAFIVKVYVPSGMPVRSGISIFDGDEVLSRVTSNSDTLVTTEYVKVSVTYIVAGTVVKL